MIHYLVTQKEGTFEQSVEFLKSGGERGAKKLVPDFLL